MNENQYTKVLERLRDYYVDWREYVNDPVLKKRNACALKRARLDGALEVSFALLGGHTPFDVELSLQDITIELGKRPESTTMNVTLKKWNACFLIMMEVRFPYNA